MHTDRHALDTHARKIYTLTHTRGDGDTAAAGPMTMTGASDGASTASAGTAGAAGFAAAYDELCAEPNRFRPITLLFC